MSILTIVFATILSVAAAVMTVGLVRRIVDYARTPVPLRIAATPAPVTRFGAGLRVAREAALFASLFKGDKLAWLLGWTFHAALLLVLVRHLRYFIEPVPAAVALVQPGGMPAGLAMVVALTGLWLRRFMMPRVRYVSTRSDHLMLALLLAIGLTGLAMDIAVHTDIIAVKTFALGLLYLDWQPLPADPILLAHLLLVAVLMAIFPASKLLHGVGMFFSPTRNQADNPREARHVTPWAAAGK